MLWSIFGNSQWVQNFPESVFLKIVTQSFVGDPLKKLDHSDYILREYLIKMKVHNKLRILIQKEFQSILQGG